MNDLRSISPLSTPHQRCAWLFAGSYKTFCWPHKSGLNGICYAQELQLAGINFKAFDLGGHEIARRVWKDYYAKVSIETV